ncbi:MAG: FHA domain-containing protein [Acidimicrobiia bacterium]|nr:FHA domain-containing protein [Acidimicrobiia bacterium]
MGCRRCGHDNEDGAQYCSACGTPLDVDEDTTAALALVEDRESLSADLGEVLDALPEGLGMLVVRRGPNAGSTFVLEGDETTLGRHPDSDVFLDDVTVSRRHATVRRIDGGYEVADAGSLNGTYVDHDRVDTALLRDMQEVQVGRFVLTFVIGGATGPAPGSAQ